MDFREVDQRYVGLKAQYVAGALSAEQFDDQLRAMMVQDDEGRWWAKARDSGEWYYYDVISDAWIREDPHTMTGEAAQEPETGADANLNAAKEDTGLNAQWKLQSSTSRQARETSQATSQSDSLVGSSATPTAQSQPDAAASEPADAAPAAPAQDDTPSTTRVAPEAPTQIEPLGATSPTPNAQAQPDKGATPSGAAGAQPQASGAESGYTTAAGSRAQGLPKWAAVKPASATASSTATAGPQAQKTAAGSKPVAEPATHYSASSFKPLPELGSSQRFIFYVLSLLIPLIGIVVFFVYRHKPAEPDRKAGKVCLLLGLVALLLWGACGGLYFIIDILVVRAGAL